ncbi:MAG TPA: LytTR family transcriptional regulator DNA-binding domain-containing protein [Bacteroidales bacterium]|nr:LytTR family transcriptional regulator DNA-binding domain-containing protein [Bacteroidales bacterium]HPS16334.1 LytTR family transcriptional regulator DNA-binding domain-containing protein [Bacteroidales bacterium]
MKIRTIIIEDEEPARALIKNYLSANNDIEIIEECADGFTGVLAINNNKPDLVLLDIQMPKLTGFEVLELIQYKPVIIFTTAFEQYAIKAFETGAADYLLKPFTKERFANALDKAKEKIFSKNKQEPNYSSLMNAYDDKEENINRIAIRTGSKIHLINADEIIYISSDDDYVQVHTKEGNFLKEKTMKYFETHLDSGIFIRIHRSFIVNINFIQRLDYYDKENYSAVLKNNDVLKVSNNGYKLLKGKLNI